MKTLTGLSKLTMTRVLLGMLIIVGVLGGTGGRGTLAYFTSTVTSNANVFTAGTLTLEGNGAATANAIFTAGSGTWKPGAFVVAPITMSNAGTLPLTYGISYTDADTGTLTTFMTVAVKAKGTASGTGAGTTGKCDNDTDFNDATLWQSSVVGSTALSTSGATLLANTSRSLAVSANEVLCYEFAFTNGAAGAENGAMGDAATFTFSFNGRQ
jgi:predicted ribosomally synthesized peptide with SipW-like signal peptide